MKLIFLKIIFFLLSFSLIGQTSSSINHRKNSDAHHREDDVVKAIPPPKPKRPVVGKPVINKKPLTRKKTRTIAKKKVEVRIEKKEIKEEPVALNDKQILEVELILNINLNLNSEILPRTLDSLNIITDFVNESIQYQLLVTGDKEENLFKRKKIKKGNKTIIVKSWRDYARKGADYLIEKYNIDSERVIYKGIESENPTKAVKIQVVKYSPGDH